MSEYNYLGIWDSKGVPTYLEPVNDVISPDLLQRIDISLPNNKPVPTYNPQYQQSNRMDVFRLYTLDMFWT